MGAVSPPPAGIGQLALTGPAADSQKAGRGATSGAKRQAILRSLSGERVADTASMTEDERPATLRQLAMRQLRALIVLTNQELLNQEFSSLRFIGP